MLPNGVGNPDLELNTGRGFIFRDTCLTTELKETLQDLGLTHAVDQEGNLLTCRKTTVETRVSEPGVLHEGNEVVFANRGEIKPSKYPVSYIKLRYLELGDRQGDSFEVRQCVQAKPIAPKESSREAPCGLFRRPHGVPNTDFELPPDEMRTKWAV